ncbi:heterochromatin protein 1-binding protein 3 isoform X2 [Myripristis murdjan]|uniref:Heterochromatin protein 1-binding protein 3 n=1 Tax=Myripristis murdjan TaxID=586833 RepID=A0A667WNJ0_9TELE|nr:heterochromatin protein 1-binding protein 3 isoform X2 [Myripristis murdjan]
MPIRRAAATPPQEKAPASAAAEKEDDATSEDSPSADEEQAASSATAAKETEEKAEGEGEPAENGEKADEAAADKKEEPEKKGLKDGFKLEKAKVKKVKRTIPAWATVTASKKVPVTNFAGTQFKMENILLEAIQSCEEKGGVSSKTFMKYIAKKYPGLDLDKRKFLIKKALKKHVEKGTLKQLKGKGLAGRFVIGKQPTSAKKIAVAPGLKTETLGDALPLIITRLCEPKEASYILIKKYLEQHFPHLDIEHRPELLKETLLKAVEKGQLERITGKGASGTFQLKGTGNKVLLKGGDLEDAITAAITAMNEPKTCSTTTLRKYLIDSNKDTKEYRLVATLRRTLTKCKMLGWMEQITGNGLNGTYQLSFPYYPSPATLYPDRVIAPPKKKVDVVKRRRTVESSDEEEESDDEPPPPKRRAQKRPPPKGRRSLPSERSQGTGQSKAKRKRTTLAKKAPAKKVVSRGKSSKAKAKKAAETASKKQSASPAKATPVKRAAPAKKPKTPAVKKLTKSGSKRPAPKESSPEPEEPRAKKEVKTKPSTRKSKRGKN